MLGGGWEGGYEGTPCLFKSPSSKVEREEDEGNSFLTAILKARFLTVCLGCVVVLLARFLTVCLGCVVVLLVGGRLLEELLATARSLRSWPSLSPREGGVAGMVEKSSLQSSVCVHE